MPLLFSRYETNSAHFWSFLGQSGMLFGSTCRECTRAHPESTCSTQKSSTDHRARRSKLEIQHLKLFSPPCLSMNRLLRIIFFVLTGFNLSNQSAHKTSITMDVDDTHGERESSLASSLLPLSSSSSRYSKILPVPYFVCVSCLNVSSMCLLCLSIYFNC